MPILNSVSAEKPREIAVRVLQQRRRAAGPFVEGLLDRALAQVQLASPDRGLCQELVYGVVRWQATLDWLIARKTAGRTQKTLLQDLLRLGLYQIFWLDRIPAHAAVNETVEQAKRSGFGPQAGFVNAVLRDYLRQFEATRQLLAELRSTQPHLGYSHPEWLVTRWQQRWGVDTTAKLLEWNNTPAKTFARVNTLKHFVRRDELHESLTVQDKSGPCVTRPSEDELAAALVERWREEGVEYDFVRRDWLDENLVFELKAHPPLAELPSFRDGGFYVQDPSTLLAVRELDPRPGQSVLDWCAAPGGKTMFIAQLMQNQGRIVAADASATRLKLVQENCVRLGVTCVEPVLASTLDPRSSTDFDRVLVDAPCSNTGVMRRRADLRWRIRPEEIERLRGMQLELLRQAAKRLKPGGALVYSTCSLEPEENGEVVKQFLAENDGFRLRGERELLPFVDGVDGAYVAALVKAR
jgi:16S rRNA (cytosine967-C5)-methyltransferase